MAPRPNIAKRAAVIKAKLENPDATIRDIEGQTGLSKSAVWQTIQQAREQGLLSTDAETLDFVVRGTVTDFFKNAKRSLAVHDEDFAKWDARLKACVDQDAEKEAEAKRRQIARDAADEARRNIGSRMVLLGNVNQQNSASPTFVMPVTINFTRSTAKPLPPLRENASEAVVVAETAERPA